VREKTKKNKQKKSKGKKRKNMAAALALPAWFIALFVILMVLFAGAIIALFVLRGKTSVGPAGPIGPRGLQGEPGTPGQDGARGFQGFSGSQGPQGNGTGGGGSVVMEQKSITIVSDPTFSYAGAVDTGVPALFTRSGNVVTVSLIIPLNLDAGSTPSASVIGPNIPFVRVRFNLPQAVAVSQAGSILSVNALEFSGTMTSNLKYLFLSEVQSGYVGTTQGSINNFQLIALFRTLDGSPVWNGQGTAPFCKTYFTVSYRCAP
jgi:hypothetical protein